MRTALLLMAITAFSEAFAQPSILQITLERIEPGRESEYGRIEEQLKQTCVRMGCPNAYLALESVSAPKEVWWLVMYESQADVERVAAAYAANEPLLKEMAALAALKKGLAAAPIEHMTKRLGAAAAWRVGAEPFAVIATAVEAPGVAAFESADGARFAIVAAATRADADSVAARLGAGAGVFAVRPEWSKPDEAWAAANPRLWQR
jgi:hypothetical protein